MNQPQDKTTLIDTLNQVFALFRASFHNQYYRAFPDQGALIQVKRLWLEALRNQSPDVILLATKRLIETQEFLPNLHQILRECGHVARGGDPLPTAHEAYMEACRAPSPKAQYAWSHPVVYAAGRACDWFFLASTPEQFAFPTFRAHYDTQVKKWADNPGFGPARLVGHSQEKAQQHERESDLSREEGIARARKLRADLGL